MIKQIKMCLLIGLGRQQIQNIQGDGRLEISDALGGWRRRDGTLHWQVPNEPLLHINHTLEICIFTAKLPPTEPPRSRSQTICDLVLAAKESWRINAICEAANGGFWVAKLISRWILLSFQVFIRWSHLCKIKWPYWSLENLLVEPGLTWLY